MWNIYNALHGLLNKYYRIDDDDADFHNTLVQQAGQSRDFASPRSFLHECFGLGRGLGA